MRCVTAPGIGTDHVWGVMVGGQLNDGGRDADLLGAITTDYHAPVFRGWGPLAVASSMEGSSALPLFTAVGGPLGSGKTSTSEWCVDCQVVTLKVWGFGTSLHIVETSGTGFELNYTHANYGSLANLNQSEALGWDDQGEDRTTICLPTGDYRVYLGEQHPSIQDLDVPPWRIGFLIDELGAGAEATGLASVFKVDTAAAAAAALDSVSCTWAAHMARGAASTAGWMATTGGDAIDIVGEFFGPPSASYSASYSTSFVGGDTANEVSARYANGRLEGVAGKAHAAANCSIVEQFHSHVAGPVQALRCATAPGIGRNQSWAITLGGVRYGRNLTHVKSSYKPPWVSSVSVESATGLASTVGGQAVTILGKL